MAALVILYDFQNLAFHVKDTLKVLQHRLFGFLDILTQGEEYRDCAVHFIIHHLAVRFTFGFRLFLSLFFGLFFTESLELSLFLRRHFNGLLFFNLCHNITF